MRYWSIKVTKGGGTLALELGEMYLGTLLTLTANPEPPFDDGVRNNVHLSRSASGLVATKKIGRQTGVFNLAWRQMPLADKQQLDTLNVAQDGPHKQLFYIPRVDGSSPTEGDAYMVRIISYPPPTETFTDIWTARFFIEEEQ